MTEPVQSAKTLQDFLEDGRRLPNGFNLDVCRPLFREALEARLEPAEMTALRRCVSDATGMDAAMLKQILKDEENRHPDHGVLVTVEDVVRGVISDLRQYTHVVADGDIYVYLDDSERAAKVGWPAYYHHRESTVELEKFVEREYGRFRAVAGRSRIRDAAWKVLVALDEPGYFADAPSGVNCANGFVRWSDELEGFVREEHSPDWKARYILDFHYDPDAGCPYFLEGIGRVLGDDENKILVLQEFVGGMLAGMTDADFADSARGVLLLYGPPSSGKSRVIDVVKMMVPQEAICSVPPGEWGNDNSRARLAGAVLNAVTELGERTWIASDQFKKIAAREVTTAKLMYKDRFEFRPRAWHLFASNALPRTKDESGGFARRWIVVQTARSLTADEVAPDFADRCRSELPGILNWALEGAQRLRRNGRFTLPRNQERLVARMQFPDDVVAQFARVGLEQGSSDDRLSNAELRGALRRFGTEYNAEVTNEAPMDLEGWRPETHMKRLAGLLEKLYGAKRIQRNSGIPHYTNVRIKPAYQGQPFEIGRVQGL